MSAKKKVTLYAARAGGDKKATRDSVLIFTSKPTFETVQELVWNEKTENYDRVPMLQPQGYSETGISAREYRRATGRPAPKLGEVREVELVLDADRRNKGKMIKLVADGYGVKLKAGRTIAGDFCGSGFNEATGFNVDVFDSKPHTLAIREA